MKKKKKMMKMKKARRRRTLISFFPFRFLFLRFTPRSASPVAAAAAAAPYSETHRVYPCLQCSRAYSSRQNLDKHVERMHSEAAQTKRKKEKRKRT